MDSDSWDEGRIWDSCVWVNGNKIPKNLMTRKKKFRYTDIYISTEYMYYIKMDSCECKSNNNWVWVKLRRKKKKRERERQLCV